MDNVSYEVTAADDALHPPTNDDPFWTETLWLAFAVPERRLTGVLYPVFRTNQGVCTLAVSLWDETGTVDHDVLYFHNFWHLPMPADLRDFALPGGFSHRCVEPLRVYDVSYDDGVEFALDLRYEALHPPIARGLAGTVAGMMQSCHVTGSLRLNGESLKVDSFELRGRGWGSRADQHSPARSADPAQVMAFSDTYAMSADLSFLIASGGGLESTTVQSGYLLKAGDLQPVVSGERTVVRRSDQGYPEELVLDIVDASGRTLHATGTCVNHAEIRSTPAIAFWANGVSWQIDGQIVWGEDHDVPVGRVARHFGESTGP
jgi:hypothetical protein